VVMPNLTPPKYRALYEIYPDKACIAETGEACQQCLNARIEAIGRQPGAGRGDSANYAGWHALSSEGRGEPQNHALRCAQGGATLD
jgi:hypothetical protein